MNYVKDKIVINAESENGKWLAIKLLAPLILILIIIDMRDEWFSDLLSGVIVVIFAAFLIGTILIFTWTEYYTLIMDKDGCTKQFLFYKRKYTWDELVVKQVYTSYVYSFDYYKEGVFFSTKQNLGEKVKHNISSYFSLHPFSCFLVNFKGTYSISPDLKYADMMRFSEVDKKYFLQKMDEWGVSLTHMNTLGRSEEKKREYIENKKNELQRSSVIVQGSRDWRKSMLMAEWMLLISTLVLVLVETTTKQGNIAVMILAVMFGGGSIWWALNIWYNLYTVIIDERGCTKILGKCRKRYLWEELQVRKICTPIGSYREGILFATKQKFPHLRDPRTYFLMHPFSSFVVNFKGQNMGSGVNNGYYDKSIEKCSVDKKLLLARFAEWGIELEDTRFRK